MLDGLWLVVSASVISMVECGFKHVETSEHISIKRILGFIEILCYHFDVEHAPAKLERMNLSYERYRMAGAAMTQFRASTSPFIVIILL